MTDVQKPRTLSLGSAPSPVASVLSADADDSRIRAAKRAAELRAHGSLNEAMAGDKYHVDAAVIPDGWTYEWKMHTVLNMENPGKQIADARAGWEAVPASRHPEMMPTGYTGATIDRDGMRLMERPAEITLEARAREYRRAREQVAMKEAQVTGMPAGPSSPFSPTDRAGNLLSRITRSTEQIAIPK